jgi:hypothetical protein
MIRTVWAMDENEETLAAHRPESSGDASSGRTHSAGEMGTAVNTEGSTGTGTEVEVIVGEIPDAKELTRMLWTARCSFADHGLLGTFESQAEAEECRNQHLVREHDHTESN